MKKKFFLVLAMALFIFNAVSLPAWAIPFTETLADNIGPLNGGLLSYYVTSP